MRTIGRGMDFFFLKKKKKKNREKEERLYKKLKEKTEKRGKQGCDRPLGLVVSPDMYM